MNEKQCGRKEHWSRGLFWAMSCSEGESEPVNVWGKLILERENTIYGWQFSWFEEYQESQSGQSRVLRGQWEELRLESKLRANDTERGKHWGLPSPCDGEPWEGLIRGATGPICVLNVRSGTMWTINSKRVRVGVERPVLRYYCISGESLGLGCEKRLHLRCTVKLDWTEIAGELDVWGEK